MFYPPWILPKHFICNINTMAEQLNKPEKWIFVASKSPVFSCVCKCTERSLYKKRLSCFVLPGRRGSRLVIADDKSQLSRFFFHKFFRLWLYVVLICIKRTTFCILLSSLRSYIFCWSCNRNIFCINNATDLVCMVVEHFGNYRRQVCNRFKQQSNN